MRDKKNILIAALLFAVIAMSVGYAAFATTLNINGSATIMNDWDVQITDISSKATGKAENNAEPSFSLLSANFDAKLYSPGDSMIYVITVENKGALDAKLSNVALTESDGTDQIIYTVVDKPEEDDILESGESTTITIKAEYNSNGTVSQGNNSKSFTGTLEYVQAD